MIAGTDLWPTARAVSLVPFAFLIGFGLLALLRHRASVGGVNILAQWLQQSRGFSAGKSAAVRVNTAAMARTAASSAIRRRRRRLPQPRRRRKRLA